MTEALRFLLVFEALMLIGLPLAARVLGRLPGMGLGFARLIGMLVLAWAVWFLASIGVPMSTGLAIVVAVALAGLSLRCHRTRPVTFEDPFAKRLLLWAEGLFVVTFVAAIWVNGHFPDVWQTEHPLDMTLLNANLTGDAMPPQDPWYAGEPLNYYYLGQNMLATGIRLTGGMEPTQAYNLAFALVFALIVSTAFVTGATLAEAARRGGVAIRRPLVGGVWCVVLLCFMGNLRAGWFGWDDDKPLNAFDWFGTTRIIPDAINEFPFATFTVGDLHAHYIAVPLVLLSVVVAAQVLLHGPPKLLSWETFAAALVIGWLYGAHSWSAPVAAGLLLAAAFAHKPRALLWAGGTVVLGILLVLPYVITVKANTKGIGLTTQDMRETTSRFLSHHLITDGTFLWLLLAPLGFAWAKLRHRWRYLIWGAAAAAILLPVLSGPRLTGTLLLAGLVAATFGPAIARDRPRAERMIWLIAAGGLGCILASEAGIVKDEFLGGPFERLNTIFKFSYHAWLLLAVFGALVLASASHWLPRRPARWPWLAVAVGLVVVGLGYVVPATWTKQREFTTGPHLEGRTWLARLYPGDVRAIDWIRANVDASDAVIVEAVGDEYSPYGYARMSTYTGRPTVMGWEFHESEYNHPPETRRPDVETLYKSKDPAQVAAIIAKYDIDYAVVGPLEETTYGTIGALRDAGREVFAAQGTKIYALGGDDGGG